MGNCFCREKTARIQRTPQAVGYGLRAWAHDAGLDEGSEFLAHWFGLGDLKGQLPRPSTWNYFSRDGKVYKDPAQVSGTAHGAEEAEKKVKAAFAIRAFA